MRSGTYRNFKISTNVYVPFLIYAMCALHEQRAPVPKVCKNFKNTNLIYGKKGLGVIIPEGENPLWAGVTPRTISKLQGGLP